MACPRRAHPLHRGGRTGGNHLCPGGMGQLHGIMPNGPRPAGYQDRLSRHIAAAKHRLHRREAGNTKRRADLERHRIRQRHGLHRRQGDEFGGGAMAALPLTVPDPNALPDAPRIDALAHRSNNASPVRMWDDSRIGGCRDTGAASRPRLGIRRVHPRDMQSHQHLARSGRRRVCLMQAQNIMRRAKARIADRAHAARDHLVRRRRITTSTEVISAPSGALGRRAISSSLAGASLSRFSSSQ